MMQPVHCPSPPAPDSLPAYEGKWTGCHTQAVYTAYFRPSVLPDPWFFEALTSVPFGVVSVPADPNRLLTCLCDPDVGLDRAFEALGLDFELSYDDVTADAASHFRKLRAWVRDGPVVIGPLNMEGLPYLFANQLFARCDHFLVVWHATDRAFLVCDTEGSTCERLDCEQLAAVWRGDCVPEGRGAFIMRRLLPSSPGRRVQREDWLRKGLRRAVANVVEAAQTARGGADGYAVLAHEIADLVRQPALRRGLTFSLPTRIQRLVCQKRFFSAWATEVSLARGEDALAEIADCLDAQIRSLAAGLSRILARSDGIAEDLQPLPALERRLSDAMISLGET